MNFFGSKDIKVYMQKWIERSARDIAGKTVVDVPAGNGVSTAQLKNVGANVKAFDLFPEFFRVEGVTCLKADLAEHIPMPDSSTDLVLCQEGIEHVSDQLKCLKEISRILEVGGRLLLTTPNYSSLRSRVSYLINESELMGKIMPPNEVDSVWFTSDGEKKMYFGHINLIGIQRLRLFAVLAGFKIKTIHANRVNYTALMMFPFFYPFICYFSWAAYRRMKRKKGGEAAASVRECFKLSISPQILLQGHLMVEFEKIQEGEKARPSAVTQPQAAQDFVT